MRRKRALTLSGSCLLFSDVERVESKTACASLPSFLLVLIVLPRGRELEHRPRPAFLIQTKSPIDFCKEGFLNKPFRFKASDCFFPAGDINSQIQKTLRFEESCWGWWIFSVILWSLGIFSVILSLGFKLDERLWLPHWEINPRE